MEFRDISNDTETRYRLKQNERIVFFLFNRSGEVTIELTGAGATAHIFALYTGTETEQHSLTLIQKHLAPDTTSSALVKSALGDQAAFSYTGTIAILKEAHRSDASQESRTLLLSPEARVFTRPALEIFAHDVRCHHAATTSPLNEASLFFAASRGLSTKQARQLLVHGFFQEAAERMETLGIETTAVQETFKTLTH